MRNDQNRDEGRERVRKVLGRWGNYSDRRLELLHDISVAEEQIESVLDLKAAPLTGMPNGNLVSDKVSRMAELYAEKKERLEQHLAYLYAKLEEETKIFEATDQAVETLPLVEKRVIRCRFVQHLTMQQTANRCYFSISGAEAAERRALDRLKELIFAESEQETKE